MRESELLWRIKKYFLLRHLARPDLYEALLWIASEVGETADLALSLDTKWNRNHPEDHPVPTAEEIGIELGDIVYMAMVAGWAIGVDPYNLLLEKMERQFTEHATQHLSTERPGGVPGTGS